jgi:hypothetical protein
MLIDSIRSRLLLIDANTIPPAGAATILPAPDFLWPKGRQS